MAARQGLSAQISQASEDAKQKLLSHAPLKSSWFSNLNTTCTIKSAPPRTPEVLSLLSNKSGWLWKRNEQHVWQARWCCVVPHTFLYYFDAGGERQPPLPLTQQMQSQLNEAVKRGYGDRPHTGPRSSFNVFAGNTAATSSSNTATTTTATTTTTTTTTHDHYHENGSGIPEEGNENTAKTSDNKSPPAGIIDLECYTAVHRSSENEYLLELAGDDAVNPDLRSFYFYCPDDEESHNWTQALLQNRHASLQDELDAFREVSTGFAAQLQELHCDLDFYKSQLEEQQDECYSVRSSAEEVRRTCFRLVLETLEEAAAATAADGSSSVTTNNNIAVEARRAFKRDIEAARDLGTVVPAVQLLCDYTKVLEQSCVDISQEKVILQEQLQNATNDDATRVKELQQELQQMQLDHQEETASLQQQVASLQQALANSQKVAADAQQQVVSTKMEMSMYQNSTKQRLQELLTHKKILKKEVIDLRQRLDDITSELSLLKHTTKTTLETVNQERKKSELLERYVERMESQVKVQQNMMELMSTTSAAASVQFMQNGNNSIVGGAGRDYQSEAPGIIVHSPPRNTTSTNMQSSSFVHEDSESAVQREHLQLMERAREMVLQEESRHQQQQLDTMDDEKSHLSELTEDRTQKQFYSMQQQQQQHNDSPAMNSTSRRRVKGGSTSTPKRLPSYIGVNDGNDSGGVPPDTPLTRSPPRTSSRRRLHENDSPFVKENGHEYEHSRQPQQLDTIMSSASVRSQHGGSTSRKYQSQSDNQSVNSSRSKQSVAQRAREAAETNSNSIRVRPPPILGGKRGESSSSLLGSIGQSLTNVIDNTVLGIPDVPGSSESTCSEDYESEDENDEQEGERYRSGRRDDVAVSETGASEVSVASTTMSLQERQAAQRAKQLAFLKEQGLIKNEANLRGGAGATPSPKSSSGRSPNR